MSSFSIAYKNFRSNIKTYGLYLGAMILAVVVYYNFISLKYNPEVISLQEASSKLTTAANSTSIVLLIFLVFFIWYSSSFFLNQRKREIGIYTFMGIEKHKVASIFAIESFFLGLTAIIIGLAIGVILSKLFIMLLAKIALLNMTVGFFISFKGLLETTKAFIIVFTITAFKGYIDITRSKLIDLFNALKKEEQMPETNYIKGVLSLVLIGSGYYISNLSLNISFQTTALATIFLVVWGTYWLFGSFSTIIAKYLRDNKSILYKGTNIISISNLVFRIKKNYKTFAAIAILVATTITAFGTVSSMKYFVDQNFKIEIPYSFSYISSDNELNETIKEIIKDSKHQLLLWESINYLNVDQFEANFQVYFKDVAVVRHSDFQRVTRDLKPKGYEKFLEIKELSNKEAIYVEKPGVIMSITRDTEKKTTTFNIKGLEYVIKDEIKTPLLGSAASKPVLIVNDEVYEMLLLDFQEYTLNGFNITEENDSEELGYKIAGLLPKDTRLFSYHGTTYYIYGILYFLGAFMSLVFITATGSIIYFKLLSDAINDKEKYQILRKIGMTDSEIEIAISKQIGISFAIPLIVGSVHSIFAIRVLSKLMNYSLVVPTVLSIIIFATIYSIFYNATTRKFLQIIGEI